MRKFALILMIVFLLNLAIAQLPVQTQVNVSIQIIPIPVEAIETKADKIEIEVYKAIEVNETQPEGCKNLCGDGICQELVCMAIGCPCPETPMNCPVDCKENVSIATQALVKPLITLPTMVSVKISPLEEKVVKIEDKPVEFKGTQEIPRLSFNVVPTPIATSLKTIEIMCEEALKKEIEVCINAGKTQRECENEFEIKVKAKCRDKTREEMLPIASTNVSVYIDVDANRKVTNISVGDVVAITKETLKFENNSLKIETPKTEISVNVLPSIATQVVVSKEKQEIKNMELKVSEDKAIYEINGTRAARILFIFPVTVPITTHLNAENGEIVKVDKPWWSILAW
jgi:hypothetical protein